MNPYFSFVIPTYNRHEYLKQAIQSILNQTYKNYEIIVTDNSSNDLSKHVCKSFNDKRIRYFKNPKNIGFVKNLYKNVNKASGKYLFILGDDDLLLEKNLLSNIHKLTSKKKYGYIRIKFIYHKKFKELFSIYFNNKNEIKTIKPKNSDLQIYRFLENSIYSFISGIIFLNTHDFTIKEIESNNKDEVDLSNFWIRYLFKNIKIYGGYIDTQNTLVAQWPEYTNPTFYNVVDNKIPEERIWELYRDIVNQKTYKSIVKEYASLIVRNFPSIKYYSNSKNVLLFAKRLMELRPEEKYNLSFYIFLLTALIIPKQLWAFIRRFYQRNKHISDEKTKKDFEILINSFN